MNYLFHLHLSILILHSISQLESRKLTEEENQKRLEVCGLTTIPKIFNGRETSVNEAPWSVMVHTSKENQQYGHCTGTLVSPRHILTATHCSASGDKEEWSSAVGKPLNREKCLENDNFIVTEVGASKVTVRSRNESIIGRAKYLFMFKLCRKIEKSDYEYLFPDDFMIVELSEDIEYSQNLQPACLARDTTDNELGTKLDFFGYGDNPPPGVVHSPEPKYHVTPKLLHQKIFVTEFSYEGNTYQTDSRVFMAQSVTSKTIACPGDSGGGAIRNIDGRNTVVGVAMQGTCAKLLRGKDGFEVYASVGYYREDVCEKTGICTPPRDSSDEKCQIFVLMVSISMSSTVNRIVKVLGEGSFGKVFLVENTTDPSRKMAMKKMSFKEEGVKELIDSECRVHEHLSRIGHENLVKMLGVVTIKTTSCIYLEYIAGGELREKIKKNGMSLQKAKFYFRQLVDGLAFLHQNHVVHRDIKPQNLLLTESDDLKIADFGLSTFYRNEDGEEKMLDGFWGTRPYGSPEMFKK